MRKCDTEVKEEAVMVELRAIDLENYRAVGALAVAPEQREFVAPSAYCIMARAYAARADNAHAAAVYAGEIPVGLLLVRELRDAPACYALDQFMIDVGHQHRGYGRAALRLVLKNFLEERKYPFAELCVKRADTSALALYLSEGFFDTGYIDPQEPDSLILRYNFEA